MKSPALLRLCLSLFCLFMLLAFVGCAEDEGGYTLDYSGTVARTDAVIEITATERSYIEVMTTSTTADTELPEVIVTGTSAQTSVTKPPETEAPKEYYTVKFVDSDGYTSVSVQTVIEGGDAAPPDMPPQKGELLFRGWNREYTNVQRSMVITAIYEKELFTVNFYDLDGTLLKTEQVHWGEDATPPNVADRDGYLFDGWNVLFNDVHTDLNVFATYYAVPKREELTLSRGYDVIPNECNVLGLEDEVYYRRTHNAMVTVGKSEYSGDRIIYGNFCDSFAVGGFDFDSFEGRLCFMGLKEQSDERLYTYSLRLTLICDGKQVYSEKLTRAGSSSRFAINLNGVKELTIVLEPLINDYPYYDEAVFIGGILDGAFYKD